MSSEESEKKDESKRTRESNTTDIFGLKFKNSDISNAAIGGLTLATIILGVKVFAPNLIPFPSQPEEKKEEKKDDTIESLRSELMNQDPVVDVVDRIDFTNKEEEEEDEDEEKIDIDNLEPLIPPTVARLNKSLKLKEENKIGLSSVEDLLE